MGKRAEETTGRRKDDRCARFAEQLCEAVLEALGNYTEPESTDGVGWYSPLWQVVRQIKGAFNWEPDLDGFESWRIVSSVVAIQDFLEADSSLGDEEDVAAAWASAWDKIRFLPGEKLLDAALRQADANPVAPPRDRGKRYARFVSVCATLARERAIIVEGKVYQDGEISIGVERWAELLRVRPNTISVWRQWALQDGVLQMTRPHSHAERRATEYRVHLDRLPPLRGTL